MPTLNYIPLADALQVLDVSLDEALEALTNSSSCYGGDQLTLITVTNLCRILDRELPAAFTPSTLVLLE